jgi:hypothetical protein
MLEESPLTILGIDQTFIPEPCKLNVSQGLLVFITPCLSISGVLGSFISVDFCN